MRTHTACSSHRHGRRAVDRRTVGSDVPKPPMPDDEEDDPDEPAPLGDPPMPIPIPPPREPPPMHVAGE